MWRVNEFQKCESDGPSCPERMPADEMSSGLTEMEKMALQQLSRKHPHQRLRTRGLGLFELASGRRVHEIAVGLEVSDKSMYMGAFLERQGDDRPVVSRASYGAFLPATQQSRAEPNQNGSGANMKPLG